MSLLRQNLAGWVWQHLQEGGSEGGVALTVTPLRSLRGLHASANTASRCRTNMEYSIRAANVDDCKDIARMIMVSGRVRGHTEKRVERPSLCVRCDLRLSASHVWAAMPPTDGRLCFCACRGRVDTFFLLRRYSRIHAHWVQVGSLGFDFTDRISVAGDDVRQLSGSLSRPEWAKRFLAHWAVNDTGENIN